MVNRPQPCGYKEACKLFVQGARPVLKYRDKQCSGLKHWLAELSSRSHYNVVGVAPANKLARMAWVVLARAKLIGDWFWLTRLACR